MHIKKRHKQGIFFMTCMALVIAFILTMASCVPLASDDLEVSRDYQKTAMEKANSQVKYVPQNFPAIDDINTYLRETETRDNWYVYALNKDGEPMFYVVSTMKPRNLCVSLTSPDRVVTRGSDGITSLSAPALDGVYYGGADCGDTTYFTDVSTGNFIEISGNQFTLISSKFPLAIETDRLVFRDKEQGVE